MTFEIKVCKYAKLVFLVARTQKPSDFNNYEIYSSIYFQFVL